MWSPKWEEEEEFVRTKRAYRMTRKSWRCGFINIYTKIIHTHKKSYIHTKNIYAHKNNVFSTD